MLAMPTTTSRAFRLLGHSNRLYSTVCFRVVCECFIHTHGGPTKSIQAREGGGGGGEGTNKQTKKARVSGFRDHPWLGKLRPVGVRVWMGSALS